MKTKRDELKAVSRIIQKAVKEGIYQSVNEGLAALYFEQGHTELHSYRQWQENGYNVKRGEKALLMWATPKKGVNHEKKSAEEKDEFSFFPIAYVFSQLQVEVKITQLHTS